MAAGVALARGGTAVLGTTSAPLPVDLPEAGLVRVVTELVGNAVVHGEGAAVVVGTAAYDGVALLTVTDEGDGLPPAFLPGAADRFRRAGAALDRPGAGLGLSLVREAVERAGGELRLCSSGAHHRWSETFAVPCTHPEAGTTATVLLPCSR